MPTVSIEPIHGNLQKLGESLMRLIQFMGSQNKTSIWRDQSCADIHMFIPCVQEGCNRIEALRLHCAVVARVRVMVGLEPPIQERAHIGWDLATEQVPNNRLKPSVNISDENDKSGVWEGRQQMTDDELIGPSDVILKVQPQIALKKVGAEGFSRNMAT